MATRKLIRDFLLSHSSLILPLQGFRPRLFFNLVDRRGYSVFNEFSKKVKDETLRNPEFQQSVKELKEKAEELKGVKEGLKEKTKQTTEQLYRQFDGMWKEAEDAAKKVSHNVREKISAATEEVKVGIGKQDSSGSTDSSTKLDADAKQGSQTSPEEEKNQEFASGNTSESMFGKFKSTFSSPNVSTSFQKLKDAKIVDITKKGYGILREELSSDPPKRRRVRSTPSGEISTKTDLVVIPSNLSFWSQMCDEIRDKVKRHPVKKKFDEMAEDLLEIYDTSDNRFIHKLQDIIDTMSQETDAALSKKEIRQRDPYFSLPEFVNEVQQAIKPVLNAYIKGDVETLKKYCCPQLIERCTAEHNAYKNNGIFYDNKILHVSDVELREPTMLESSPVIVAAFKTQQIYCVRDRNGEITEGGKVNAVFFTIGNFTV
ncbi:import inner membrane translocase subunit TIM44-2 [Medicago truncatula]|uniref:Import inner membrane translocase subunit TIM44-2 n=1 Tax=Medicago truncatula TaxID=3880 RepID=A0A072UMI6_MEDTR|nr:import inner membrane translocase subunit TIM44-2 [Medicago truncatula]